MIAALLRQFVGEIQEAVQFIRDIDMAFLPGHARQAIKDFAQARAQCRNVDAGLRKERRGRAVRLIQQRDQQMRRFQHVVVASDRETLRIGERLLETRGEFVGAHGWLSDRAPSAIHKR